MLLLTDSEIDEFNPEELSLLMLTNDGEFLPSSENGNKLLLTTKETYIWGIILAQIVKEKLEVDEEIIVAAYKRAVQKNHEFISEYYRELPTFPFPFVSYQIERIYYNLITSFYAEMELKVDFEYIYEQQKKAFDSLVEKEYIVDPVFTTVAGISLAVAGLIPYGFTKKRKNGRVVLMKIEALYWSYQKSEQSKNNETTKINFRLWKIITAFKKAFADVIDDENKDTKE
jgi:hypothetical protein